MQLSKLIEELKECLAEHGDVQCVVEVLDEIVPVEEVSVETRVFREADGHETCRPCAKFLI